MNPNLPEPVHQQTVIPASVAGQAPNLVYIDGRPYHVTPQQPTQPQVVHIHQAPPDRTVQRVALGAGMGGGMAAACVYFGPLLVASMASMAASLAILALVAVAGAWGVVSVIRTVDGHQAAKANRKALARKGH